MYYAVSTPPLICYSTGMDDSMGQAKVQWNFIANPLARNQQGS